MTTVLEQTELAGGSNRTTTDGVIAVRRRRRMSWPAVFGLALVATGLAYSFLWGPVVQHGSHWTVPGDIWGTWRAAHFVGWGDIGDVYGSGTGLVTFPLIAVVLAPAAMLSGALGLTENIPYFLPHPTAWFVLGPAQLLIGASTLFPLDALVAKLGVSRSRRVAVCFIGAVVLWPVVALWGHPEDPLAMTFALYGLLAAFDGRWARCGWLWGAALATQPLVVLVVPILFGLAPVRRWAAMTLKMMAPTLALVAIPLAQEWAQTSRALFQQPNYPSIDHPTPWLALAPVLSRAHVGVTTHIGQTHVAGVLRFTTSVVTGRIGKVVAAGPGRLIALALCVAIGVWVYRRRPSPIMVVWLAALALSLRCVFESVMNPYYLWPPLALALVAAATCPARRFALVVGAALAVTWYSYRHTGPWAWYLPMISLLAVAVWSSRPRRWAPRLPATYSSPPDGEPSSFVARRRWSVGRLTAPLGR